MNRNTLDRPCSPRRYGSRPVAISIVLLLTAGFFCPSRSAADDGQDVEAFLSELSGLAAQAGKEDRSAIKGSDGWLFFMAELRALTAGPFWGERAAAVSRASNSRDADPLPAIVDFHDQLKRAGIELLIVPVPAKAAIYPERISTRITAPAAGVSPHLDPYHEQFYRMLGERGVPVLDPTPLFLEQRQVPGADLYCKTDTHWSGKAAEVVAQAIAKRVEDRPWLKKMPRSRYEASPRRVEITGDLARMIDEGNPAREALTLTFVGRRGDGQLTPVEPDRDSPVLLVGDSHTLVFHDPDLHARGAGLPDHLALRLGFPVDLVGIRGSASTTPRIELLRRRDNLKGKKLVVWCFSCREFTESTTGWRKVPVIRSHAASDQPGTTPNVSGRNRTGTGSECSRCPSPFSISRMASETLAR